MQPRPVDASGTSFERPKGWPVRVPLRGVRPQTGAASAFGGELTNDRATAAMRAYEPASSATLKPPAGV